MKTIKSISIFIKKPIIMKKLLLSIFSILFICTLMLAQEKPVEPTPPPVEVNCHIKWAQRFEERGAYDVEDGSYSDVIITIRRGTTAECYNGKVDVVGGNAVAMYIKLEDGTFEQIKRKLKYDQKDFLIINGMSKPLITINDELITVMFVKKIKPKKKGYVKAADPSDFN